MRNYNELTEEEKNISDGLSDFPSNYYQAFGDRIENQDISQLLYDIASKVAAIVGTESAIKFLNWQMMCGIHDFSLQTKWCRQGMMDGVLLTPEQLANKTREFWDNEMKEHNEGAE